MELRLGYKHTDIGALPEDWSICKIGDVCGFIVPGRNKPKRFDGDIPWITTPDLDPGRRVSASRLDLCISSSEAAVIGSRIVPVGSILMSCAGELGITAITRSAMVINQQLHAFIPSRKVKAMFLLHVIASQKAQIERLATKTAVPYLNKTSCNSIRIPLPVIAEQVAIANALSDADAAIESLEQLLDKKRQVKQGAMQELLTGKRRLPGFHEHWQVRRLDELADIRSGGTPSTAQTLFWDGGIPWCTPTDITALAGEKYLSATARAISPLGFRSSSAEMIPAKSVVMTSRATIGECAINLVPVTTNQGFKNFVPLDGTNVEFLFYLLLMQKGKFVALCGGSTFPEIGKTHLERVEVLVPPTEREQAEIAHVLSAMDEEIAMLKSKLEKACQLKLGMMQQLLTGRIRLVDAKPAEDLQLVQPA